jgi:hypothetical protein
MKCGACRVGEYILVNECNRCGARAALPPVRSEALLADLIRDAQKLGKLIDQYPIYQMPASVVSEVKHFIHELSCKAIPHEANHGSIGQEPA